VRGCSGNPGIFCKSHNQKSYGSCVCAFFDILCGDRVRTRNHVAAAHATTDFVAERKQASEGAAITHHQGGLPLLFRLLLCHRRLFGLHDHQRMLCTGRRMYRSMLKPRSVAGSLGGLFSF
jgi:hypothetical protein